MSGANYKIGERVRLLSIPIEITIDEMKEDA